MDWQLTCRVCLETGDMVSLFDWDENNEQLSDKYTYCCGVKVTKNDSLPTLICLNCVDRLTYAYQFKQQCLSSNETLKECLQEFERSSQAVASGSKTSKPTETETITIKQENGLLLQYQLPVEHEPTGTWSNTLGSAAGAVLTKAPAPRKRGRRRKYPNEEGKIDLSPYQRKKPKESDNEPESLTSLLASGSLELKEEAQTENEGDQADDEPFGADFPGDDDEDPEFNPDEGQDNEKPAPRKRGRPRKNPPKKEKPADDSEDVLLRETIMAFSEPIPEHLLNPKPKKKYVSKKRYDYGKTHTCETCGSSFTSNASLQAHIRRHLGIKPYVCSVCGYACVLGLELKRHMLRHTGEKPLKCRICDCRFRDTSTRLKHERLHMGLRPYQCSLCGKAFTYSYVLSNHMLTHTGEKKYHCGPCNKKFTKAHHLKYHNKVHHKELYHQQLLEAEAKKAQQAVNNAASLSGVLTGKIVDGTLHIVQADNEDGDLEQEQDGQMQLVVEEEEGDNSDCETSRAVADIQSVELDAEFSMDEEEIKGV